MKTIRQTINDIKKLFKDNAIEFKIKSNKVNEIGCSLSGFIKFANDTFIYVSTKDIRFCNNYRQEILFRTAKSYKDFTGGMNNFFNLDRVGLTGDNIYNYLFGVN